MSRPQERYAKKFQEATADAALVALTSISGPRRFLVADEVGLGKTVVARSVIEKMMYRKRTKLTVFYISSNLNIAHQNRKKLLEVLPESERASAMARADRLTIAIDPGNRPSHPRLHLYTLTPDTSVPMFRRRGSNGRMRERALIFRLLSGRFPSLDQKWFWDICQGRGGAKNWKYEVDSVESIREVRNLQDALLSALEEDTEFSLGRQIDAWTIHQRGDSQCAESMPSPKFIARIRTALARAALREINPDLVIFDEFQKFRELLIPPDPTYRDSIAEALRGESTQQKHGVLLLSATPYRLYTTKKEDQSGTSHYNDFFELIAFLLGDNKKQLPRIKELFREFGDLMISLNPNESARLQEVRDSLEKQLRPIMSRTERRESAFERAPSIKPVNFHPDDLRVFRYWAERLRGVAAEKARQAQSTSFAVPYWLSMPLPMQTLGKDYVAWRRASHSHAKRFRDEPAFRKIQRDRLIAPENWPHPQFRALQNLVPSERLALPWVNPSLPWWQLQGPWAKQEVGGGKLLIFSRFKAVPPALAAFLSFSLDASFRTSLKTNAESAPDADRATFYDRARICHALELKNDRPTLPALFFPSPTLIRYIDPLRDEIRSLREVQKSMRDQVRSLLQDKLHVPVRKNGRSRPIWQLLPALESTRSARISGDDLPSWEQIRDAWRAVASRQIDTMQPILDKWDGIAEAGLSYITRKEISLLAWFALSGPGVVLGRSLSRIDKHALSEGTNAKEKPFINLLTASWNGLRRYLNKSLFQALLTRKKQPYTRAIPEAVIAGNLEAVFDEHFWIQDRLGEKTASAQLDYLNKAFGLPAGNAHIKDPAQLDISSFSLRCHAAMPFTSAKIADQEQGKEESLRTDDMRKAFNTPFWPHVLVTTSVGQEGLDFHVWCGQILHWDLCSGPIELEQREGRIQRFGSLSIRRALAEQFRTVVITGTPSDTSTWARLEGIANESYREDESGLRPWWTCEGEHIERLFFPLPNSRATQKYRELHELRVLYRLALGQPHQQDFVKELQTGPIDGRRNYALRLSAWRA